jgi:hypothetical protein
MYVVVMTERSGRRPAKAADQSPQAGGQVPTPPPAAQQTGSPAVERTEPVQRVER